MLLKLFAVLTVLVFPSVSYSAELVHSIKESSPFLYNVFDYSDFRNLPIIPLTPAAGFLRSVGVVQSPIREGFATAFLVSDCHALTSGHVAFDEEDHQKPSTEVTVTIGFGRYVNGSFEEKVIAHPVKGGWQELTPGALRIAPFDWALLRLAKCVGTSSQFGHLLLNNAPVEDLMYLRPSMAGFPVTNGFEKGITYEKVCSETVSPYSYNGVVVRGVLRHYCDARPGLSGAPLMVRDLNNEVFVVGINKGDSGPPSKGIVARGDQTRFNFATEIANIRDRVVQLIEQDLKAHPLQ